MRTASVQLLSLVLSHLATKQEVPGSSPSSAVGFFSEEDCPTVCMDWVVFNFALRCLLSCVKCPVFSIDILLTIDSERRASVNLSSVSPEMFSSLDRQLTQGIEL